MGKAAESTNTMLRKTPGGAASLMVAVSLILLAGFSALAVDYAYLHHRKDALRRAAEAGALTGAEMLVGLGRDVEAVRDATVQAAQAVLDRDDSPSLAVRDSDVVFFGGGVPDVAAPDQIQVTAGRTDARGNPVSLLLGWLLGQRNADVSVSARAGLYCAETSEGLAPLILPAGYAWDDACDPDVRRRGNGVLDAGSPCEADSVEVFGYGPKDVGRRLVLLPGRFGEVLPGGVFSLSAKPGGPGGASPVPAGTIRDGSFAVLGELMDVDAGADAMALLRDQARLRLRDDPGAFWDEARLAVRGSRHPNPETSPRMARVAFFDPALAPVSERPEVRVCQLGAVFIEELREDGGIGVRLARAMALAPQRAAAACDSRGVGLYGVRLAPAIVNGVQD